MKAVCPTRRLDRVCLAAGIITLHAIGMILLGLSSDPELQQRRSWPLEAWTPWSLVPWQLGLPTFLLEAAAGLALLRGHAVGLTYLRLFAAVYGLGHSGFALWGMFVTVFPVHVIGQGPRLSLSAQDAYWGFATGLLPLVVKAAMFAAIWYIAGFGALLKVPALAVEK